MKAKDRLAQLEEDRASRLRQAEAAQIDLEAYQDHIGALSVGGTPTEDITAELARLRDAIAVQNAAVDVLTVAIEEAKQQIHVERRQACAQKAEGLKAELDKHAAKVEKLAAALAELEEVPQLVFEAQTSEGTKSMRLQRDMEHWQLQAQRMGHGLPEMPKIY